MYLAEKIESEYDVAISEETRSELDEFVAGIQDRLDVDSSFTVESPSEVRVVLSSGQLNRRDLKQFATENKNVVSQVFSELEGRSDPTVDDTGIVTTVEFTVGLAD